MPRPNSPSARGAKRHGTRRVPLPEQIARKKELLKGLGTQLTAAQQNLKQLVSQLSPRALAEFKKDPYSRNLPNSVRDSLIEVDKLESTIHGVEKALSNLLI